MHNTVLLRHHDVLADVRKSTQIMVYVTSGALQLALQAAFVQWKERRPDKGKPHPDGSTANALACAFANFFRGHGKEEVRTTMEALAKHPRTFQNFRLINRRSLDKAPEGTWTMVVKLAPDSPEHRKVADYFFHLADSNIDLDGATLARDTAPMDDLTRRISQLRM